MTLKEWNTLQIEMFDKFKLEDTIVIFQVASVISSFKFLELNEQTANEVLKTIEKELCRKGNI